MARMLKRPQTPKAKPSNTEHEVSAAVGGAAGAMIGSIGGPVGAAVGAVLGSLAGGMAASPRRARTKTAAKASRPSRSQKRSLRKVIVKGRTTSGKGPVISAARDDEYVEDRRSVCAVLGGGGTFTAHALNYLSRRVGSLALARDVVLILEPDQFGAAQVAAVVRARDQAGERNDRRSHGRTAPRPEAQRRPSTHLRELVRARSQVERLRHGSLPERRVIVSSSFAQHLVPRRRFGERWFRGRWPGRHAAVVVDAAAVPKTVQDIPLQREARATVPPWARSPFADSWACPLSSGSRGCV